MPGPAKDNLSNNATVVLTKQEGKDINTQLKHATMALPQNIDELRRAHSAVLRELLDLHSAYAHLKARVDKLEVGGAGTNVTF
jgi:hypothetical protein